MKVLLYFGHHKVGSTALQTYFARNALALAKQGILYPAVESQGVSHLLAQAMGLKSAPDLNCMNVREPHNALGFRMLAHKMNGSTPAWHGKLPGLPAMLSMLRHQVEILQPHTLVLCSEVFANFSDGHQDMIICLRDLFPEADYELYCALRRPDEYIVSWYGQRLRFGHKLPSLSEWQELGSIHFNYRKMVAPWAEVFMGSPLHLRSYSEILTAGGSVEDFTDQTSCKFPKDLSKKGSSNTSLPRIAYEVLRQANTDLPQEQAQHLRTFFLSMTKSHLLVRDQDIEFFGTARRQELFDAFVPIHSYLSALSGKAAFFPDIEAMLSSRPVPAQDATRQLLGSLAKARLPSSDLNDYIAYLNSKS